MHRSSRGQPRSAHPNSTHALAPMSHPAGETPQVGPQVAQSNTSKTKRTKWTREEYKQVMQAFLRVPLTPSGESNTKQSFTIWRKANPTARPNMDSNKLANIERDIINNKRLADVEPDTIRQSKSFNQNKETNNENSEQNEQPENREIEYETAPNQYKTPFIQEQDEEEDSRYETLKENILRKREEVNIRS